MMADFGVDRRIAAVGQIAQHSSFGVAFLVSGVILLVAAIGLDVRARDPACGRPTDTPARPLGPEAGGELP